MLCLSVDIGLMLAVSNIFLFSLLQSIVFFSVIIILFQTCIFSSSILASPMSSVHFIGAPWFLSIFSLYSQFSVCSWFWKLFIISGHSEVLFSKHLVYLWRYFYFSWSLPYSWYYISIISLLFLLSSYVTHLLLHVAYFSH